MILTGLASVTFNQLPPERIIALVAKAGLVGIEWSGGVHVPHGDIKRARLISQMTVDAGLKVASYGSYYKVGENEKKGVIFQNVLETAIALGAQNIRVWAGNQGSAKADKDYWMQVVEDTRNIADQAENVGIKIAYEFHGQTLTDTGKSTRQLLKDVGMDNVMTYWQPIIGMPVEENLADIDMLMSWVSNIHVFHWWPKVGERHLLSAGLCNWKHYFHKLSLSGLDHYALLEFVKSDKPENFTKDSATLKSLLES